MFPVRTMKKCFQGVLIAILVLVFEYSYAQSLSLPRDIIKQIPSGHVVMTFASSDFNGDGKVDYVVVARVKREDEILSSLRGPAPNRPLLVFIQDEAGKFILKSRNDEVVFNGRMALQCDPFKDQGGLVAKGPFFTVEHTVACGQHWTDFITFRYSSKLRNFIFHKRVSESWNPLESEEYHVLSSVTKADKRRPVLLDEYTP